MEKSFENVVCGLNKTFFTHFDNLFFKDINSSVIVESDFYGILHSSSKITMFCFCGKILNYAVKWKDFLKETGNCNHFIDIKTNFYGRKILE